MNTIKSLILTLALLPGTMLMAQKKFSEGTITYDIAVNTGSDKPQNADFLDGATSTVYLKGLKSRSEMSTSLGTQSTIIDGTNNNIVILKEFGEQKFMINLTPADWQDANKKYEGMGFTFTNETKTIMGYKATKAVGKLQDGTSFTVWYTPDLVPENHDFQFSNKTLPGLALEYETSMGSKKVTYTLSKLSFNVVPASKFDLPTSGYRVMTYSESKRKN